MTKLMFSCTTGWNKILEATVHLFHSLLDIYQSLPLTTNNGYIFVDQIILEES